MTEEIQKRIEAIKAGKVPDGYKKSIVGIVPGEWQEKRLSDLLRFQNGVNAEKEKFNSGIKMISVMDILDERPIVYDAIRGQVDIDEKALNNYSVTYGDILFQRSSETVEDAGKSNVYMDRDKTATYSGFVIRGKKIADYDPIYLNELLKTTGVRQQIIKYAAGSQHINVSQDSLARVRVCLASEAEQKRIEKILLKWNKAIELQENLIEKLELQKRALMQSLLIPKCGWKKVKIGTLTKELSVRNYQNKCNNVKSVSNKDGFIDQEEQFSKRVASLDTSNYKRVTTGNIAYNPSRINVGSIAVYEDKEDGIVSPMYVVLECERINPHLLLLLLNSAKTQYDIKSYLAGSVRDSLNYSDLEKIEIFIPSEDEQSGLVNFFGKYELLCTTEKNKLKFLRRQQKAVRQLLLTGIVRV